MLSRDAKDWKVCSLIVHLTVKIDIDLYRPKITTPFLVCPSTAGVLPPSRSSAPTARRSSAITPTRRPPWETAMRTTTFSSVSRKRTSC